MENKINSIKDIKSPEDIKSYFSKMKDKRDVLYYLSWDIDNLKADILEGKPVNRELLEGLEKIYNNDLYNELNDFMSLKCEYYSFTYNKILGGFNNGI